MSNLFWKKPNKTVVNVAEKPFSSEEALESYLVETKELLSDIFIFKRQVRGNAGKEIPDLVGVDKENNIVLIELKNTLVDEDIAPQVLRYAIWAETNPDSIKALWLEYEDKPDEIEINWDSLSIRIIVVGPQFKSSVPRMVSRINYAVDLLEIKRFSVNGNEFITIKDIEPEKSEILKVTKAQQVYDKAFYLENYNKNSVKRFMATVKALDSYQKRKNWDLKKKFNKYYAGFKYGFFNVFGVKWLGSKSFGIFFKVPEPVIKKSVKKHPLKYRDDSQWGELVYRIGENEAFKPNALEELLKKSYSNIVGVNK